MTTVNQNFTTRIGGINFSSSNNYTGTSVATINGIFELDTSAQTIPVYAEADADGDIKLIVIKSSRALDVCKLIDGSGGTTVIDILGAYSGSTIPANTVIQLPGTAQLPTITNTNDIFGLNVALDGSDNNLDTTIEFAILYDVATDLDSPDTIVSA